MYKLGTPRAPGFTGPVQGAGTPFGLVIDLVSTSKFYNAFLEEDGVEYKKHWICSQAAPPHWIQEAAFEVIDWLTRRANNPNHAARRPPNPCISWAKSSPKHAKTILKTY